MAITLDKTQQHTNRHQDNPPAPTPSPARRNRRPLGVVVGILGAVAVLAAIVSGPDSSGTDQSYVTAENNRFAALASVGTGQTTSYDIAEQNRFSTLASVGAGQTTSYDIAERNRFAAVGLLAPATSYELAERNRFNASRTLGSTGDVSGTTQAERNRAAALSAINGRNQTHDHSYDAAEQNRFAALADHTTMARAFGYQTAENNRFDASRSLGSTGNVSGTTQAERNRAAALSAINGRNQTHDHSYDVAEQNRMHAVSSASA